MRLRFALALLISIILIGGASWYRFGTTEYVQPNIIAVEQSETNYKNAIEEFLGPKAYTASSTPSSGPLTNTDIIGRSLLSDYILLEARGNATDANIIALADKYVQVLPTLNVAPTIDYVDIKTTSNTKINFQNYANRLEEIYEENTNDVSRAYAEAGSPDTSNPAIYSFISTFGTIYAETASKLQNMSVPLSLVGNHLQLVNGYLSSATGMEAISKIKQDPSVALAGLMAINESLNKEEIILDKIRKILISNGI